MAVTLDIDLQVKIEEAVRQSAKASTQISKQLDGITGTAEKVSKSVNLINFAGIAIIATQAARAIGDVFAKAVDEAVEADNAIRRLNNALVLAGDFSEGASQSFADLANEIERTTKFTEEQALAAAAIGKRFNLTNGETQDLVKAAADLAIVLGVDLESAAASLGKTFDGTIGRLGEEIPELKRLSKEALQAGEAIKFVNDNFGGAASRDVESYGGLVNKTGKAFDNIFESIGSVVINNDALKASLKSTSSTLDAIATTITDNSVELDQILTLVIEQFFRLSEAALRFFQFIVEVPLLVIVPFEAVLEVIKALYKTLQQLVALDFKNFGSAFNDIGKNLNGFGVFNVAQAIKSAADQSGALAQKVSSIQKTEQDRLSVTTKISEETERQQRIAQRQKKTADELKKLKDDELAAAKKISDEEKARIQRFEQFLQSRSQNPFAQPQDIPGNSLGLSEGARTGIATGIGIGSNVLRGRQGAVNLISQGAEAAGRAFLGVPGLGEVVGLLSQGPDAVRQLIREFADAIPDVVVAIAEAIPVVFETLAEKLPEIIEKLVERAPRIIEALVKASPQFIITLNRVFAEAAFRFVGELLKGAANFVGEILRGAGEFISRLISSIGEGLNRIVNELIKALDPSRLFGGGGGGGGGGDLLSGLVGGIGAAIGGIFGKSESQAGSGFAPSLQQSGQSTQPMNVVVKVGQRELAQAMVELSKQGFRTA